MTEIKDAKTLLQKIKHLENENSILKKEKYEFEIKFMELYNDMEKKVRDRAALIQEQKFKLQDEIQKREIIEENLRKALSEKNYLFRELHHRVKNNLQMISSIINLQIKDTKNQEVKLLLEESRKKINSMALVHDFIYDSGTSDKINLSEYLEFLSKEVFKSNVKHYSLQNLNLKIEKGIVAPLKISLPCGLIINELITNSLKHAFPEKMKGEIFVELKQKKATYYLIVTDTGIGISEDQFNQSGRNLGLNLVKMLVENQLKGKINWKNGKGTKITIMIPDKSHDQSC
ncbi:MAG: sensor histidine kinase [Candidatus Marinimicrobia bacterium]|nr:sensor histidine kinase [Candidatus Neomarinimicrobiota bacterium]